MNEREGVPGSDSRLPGLGGSLLPSSAATEAPSTVALVTGESELTWHELDELVQAAAALLVERGACEAPALPASLPPESPRVCVVGARGLDTIVAVLALVELGVPFALLHPRWTASERQRILDALRPTVVLDESWRAPQPAAVAAAPRPPVRDDERPLAVLFTSGTSGTPKGAVLSRRAFRSAAGASEQVLGWRDGDRWLLSLPLAHVGGLSVLTRVLAARRTVVLDPAASFAPDSFVATVERHRVTLASLVPTMLHRLVAADLAPPRSLRAVLLGGARASAPLLQRARSSGWPVLATYGLTEACSQVATQRPRANGRGPSEDPGCGAPLPGFEVRVAGAGSLAPQASGTGEILIGGDALFSGYLRLDGSALRFERFAPDPQQGTAQETLLATGDVGTLDEHGCLHVLDRRTDLVITGGENVYPAEVEQVLESCPGVEAACVFGIDDELWGQVVAAALVAVPGRLDEDTLRLHLEALAPFKRPRKIFFAGELPLLPNGKVDRNRCKTLLRR